MAFGLMNLRPDLRQMVEQELETMEHVRWVAQPRPGRLARKALPIVLFAIPFTGFAVFWLVMAFTMTRSTPGPGPAFLFPLFGVPFLLVGLAMLSSPLWYRRKARRTVYVITDRRAIVFSGGWSTTVDSFDPAKIKGRSKRLKGDGSGDIIFEERLSYYGSHHHGNRPPTLDIGFLALDDVRQADELLKDLVEASERRPA